MLQFWIRRSLVRSRLVGISSGDMDDREALLTLSRVCVCLALIEGSNVPIIFAGARKRNAWWEDLGLTGTCVSADATARQETRAAAAADADAVENK